MGMVRMFYMIHVKIQREEETSRHGTENNNDVEIMQVGSLI